MDCPICRTERLVMSERQGIEIDYCPKCRGVWLDRGELDKILERAAAEMTRGAVTAEGPGPALPTGRSEPRPEYAHDGGRGHHGYRRKSFLGELFD